jgi:hypothetical protein
LREGALVEHDRVVGDRADQVQVVTEQHDGDAGVGEAAQFRGDLGAVQAVLTGGGFVRHEQPGVGQQGVGDDEALLLAAGELVRVAPQKRPVGGVDLCVTSPPYMTATDHPQNPLTAYQTVDGDYATYLAELGDIFGQVAALLRPGAHAVINVANLVTGPSVTPLAWDVARTVGDHLALRQEVFLCWDQQPTGISADYCLVFQHAGQR